MDTLARMTTGDLLDRLASKSPVPGGGAVAGLVGAQAAALARMVVSYSLGRRSLADHQRELEGAALQLDNARGVLLALADEDAQAYAALSNAWGSRGDDRAVFEAAVRSAIRVPQAVVAACGDLLRLCERLGPISNPNLRSDLVGAAVLAEASSVAAGLNIRVNALQLADAAERDGVLSSLDAALVEHAARRDAVVRV
ncbi:MAG: cyclodeaminase/cyclohydrolase family protein [Planctomycetota bacterium]